MTPTREFLWWARTFQPPENPSDECSARAVNPLGVEEVSPCTGMADCPTRQRSFANRIYSISFVVITPTTN